MSERTLMAVGCLNREAPYLQGARGRGIALSRFDEATGAAEMLCETGDLDNPTFVSLAPDGRALFATSEVFGRAEGVVAAYALDPETGALTYRNMQPSLGSITAYNAVSADGRFLMLANYAMGRGGPDRSVAVFPIREDGSLGPACDAAAHEGPLGPVGERQERPHAHCLCPVGRGGDLLCADLGLDALIAYRLGADGSLVETGRTALDPGAGPRHIVADAEGALVFVINELASTVQSFTRDGGGALTPVSACAAVPEGTRDSHCADLQIAPDGRFLYASNRGHDSIAIFAVDPATAALTPAGHVPTGGATPRSFCLSPSGRFLVVANQNADEIVVFARDADTGALEETGPRLPVGTPMCVRMVAA